MAGLEQGSAVPDGLRFALPAAWFPLRLPADADGVDRLLAGQAASFPELAGWEPVLRSMLDGLTELGRMCVFRAYAAIVQTPAGQLPAGLAIGVVPGFARTVDELGAAGRTGWSRAQAFDLPAGRVLRTEEVLRLDGIEPPVPGLVVQYVAVVPGSDRGVVMTFSSPALTLARQLRLLFHEIACTLSFDAREPETAA